MFWKNYWKQFNRAERLQNRVNQLEAMIADHKSELGKRIQEDIETSTFALDFDVMNVFSIERNNGGNVNAQTIVGYFVTKATDSGATEHQMHQWYLNCSHDEHQRLVKQFTDWKAKKK
jgi:hypothetical protein